MINIASNFLHFYTSICLLMLAACGTDNNTVREQGALDRPLAHSLTSAKLTRSPVGKADYVGSGTCAHCHQRETAAWLGSHHDLAMKTANENSVLGNFNQSKFIYQGVTSTFYKKGDRYYVETDGPDGTLQSFPVAYTFGVNPLQQYLVKYPRGRIQALSIVWDNREKSEGGQRWFHLFPDEKVDHSDPLHWSGINQNWNFMCADCHSTNLRKNYDLNTDTFQTAWSEINVACEACHGPASKHLEWAHKKQKNIDNLGFAIKLQRVSKAQWEMDLESGIAKNRVAKTSQELQTCAQCHSRRTTYLPGAMPGDKFLDHYNPTLLQPPLYHADGQINGEVYVYGSFLQSKMYKAGVTCSNCHEPHSLQLRSTGNTLCAQCHLPEKFATTEHHLHVDGSPGAQCINCHMPAKVYMQVDNRRDHSFRIPRPDLSDKLHTPNACTGCHKDKANQWAADILLKEFGPPDIKHYGEAIYAGIHGADDAESKLSKLITDSTQPAIARATAVSLLPQYLSRHSVQLLQAVSQSNEPLLSLALAQSLDRVPPQLRPALGIPLLFEQDRVTRSLAANALAYLPMDPYPVSVQKQFSQALREYTISELLNSDRPESLVNLGGLHLQKGNPQQAEAFYRRAINRAPYFAPAYVNLADLYRGQGREKDAELLLRRGLTTVEGKASIQHSLGLSLVRQNRHSEAMPFLRKSAESDDTHSRYIYVYGIALNSAGQSERALEVLQYGLSRFPGNTEIVQALVSISRESGNPAIVNKYQYLLRDN
ncbi:tetratricopeptide repeat protein [Microbulbifer epialgicus]|uniref:Tetratricopeptide repeat protein n=1 Tax=Microbulbifer epialgicus TaxID=393907 RepID=A0ABV4NWS8_9GAMM